MHRTFFRSKSSLVLPKTTILGARLLVAALALSLIPAAVRAQGSYRPATGANLGQEEAANAFAIFGAVTFVNGSIDADAFDRRLFLTGVRYSRQLVHNRLAAFSYTPEIIPASWLSQPILGDSHMAVQRSSPYTHTERTYAAGLSPIGFELSFMPARKLQPLVGTEEGFLYFQSKVPSPLAAQLNFTLDVRLGFRVHLDRRNAFSLEYVYHHLSNGYKAPQNPGVESQMLCFGYVRMLHRS